MEAFFRVKPEFLRCWKHATEKVIDEIWIDTFYSWRRPLLPHLLFLLLFEDLATRGSSTL